LESSMVSRALILYSVVLLGMTALTWAVYLWAGKPYFRPLFFSNDRFKDLLNYADKTAHLWRSSAALGEGYPVFSYPPPSAVLWHVLLHSIHGHPLAPYLFLAVIAIAAYGILAFRASDLRPPWGPAAGAAIEITAIAGFPFWFAIDRGNLEALVSAISGAGLCFLLRRRYRAAAVCIGLAVCIKPFPIVFLILFLLHRRYKEVILAIGVAGALVFAGLVVIGPNPWKAYQDLKPGAAIYTVKYLQVVRPAEETRFAHSVLDGMKSAAVVASARSLYPSRIQQRSLRIFDPGRTWYPAVLLSRIYPWIAAIILLALVSLIAKSPILNQLTVLGIAVTLLPPNSVEYTLLNLYVPFGALLVFLTRELAAGRLRLDRRVLFLVMIAYALLFSPLSFLGVYAGDVKLLLLLLLAVCFVHAPMPSPCFGDALESNPDALTQTVLR
jgi:hypothetical protein